MANAGSLISIDTSSYNSPSACCNCGGPPETHVETTRAQKRGNTTTTLKLRFPYCNACAQRIKSYNGKLAVAYLLALGLAVIMSAIIFFAPMLLLPVALGVAAIVGIGGSVLLTAMLRPSMPPEPATSRTHAVRIKSFSGNMASLLMTNPGWADAFARANGASLQPKSAGDSFLIGPIITAALCVPVGALVAWMVGHPTVYIDNATNAPIQVYLDGEKSVVVGANAHASIDVGHGKHTFGWSAKGETAPTSKVEAAITVGDEHLYNPGKSACYWLVTDVYGEADTDGVEDGPLTIQEMYHFDKVDTWFGENPQSIEVSNGSSGGTRTALQRSNSCMELVTHDCSMEARVGLVACQRKSKGAADFEACFDQAQTACAASPAVATGKKPAAKAPVGGKPAPVKKPSTGVKPL